MPHAVLFRVSSFGLLPPFECGKILSGEGGDKVFRPTNPNDRHLTMLELQDWERQRDSKKDDFPFIHLSRKELILLKSTTHGLVEITPKNQSAACRLRDLVFIRILQPKSNVEVCEIRIRGRNFLHYLSGEKSEKRRDHIHDWKIAVFSALAGALLSQPMWDFLRWLFDFFQQGKTPGT